MKTYEAILNAVGWNIYFFNYDRACAEPAPSLEELALALGLEDPTELLAQVSRFRKPSEHAKAPEEIDTSLRAQVWQVYKAIEAQSFL